jgi:hypothetical protein
LEQQLASSQVPREEQIKLIEELQRKETEYMRLKRHRICVDDFELLTIIGRGAFGEVCIFQYVQACLNYFFLAFQIYNYYSFYDMFSISSSHFTK